MKLRTFTNKKGNSRIIQRRDGTFSAQRKKNRIWCTVESGLSEEDLRIKYNLQVKILTKQK